MSSVTVVAKRHTSRLLYDKCDFCVSAYVASDIKNTHYYVLIYIECPLFYM